MLKKFTHSITLIYCFTRLEMMSRMENVLGFVLITIGIIVRIAMQVIFFQAIFSRVPMIAGWSFNETLVLIGTFQLVEGYAWVTHMKSIFRLPESILDGSFDTLLVKPLNMRFLLTYIWNDILFSSLQLLLGLGIIFYITGTTNLMNIVGFFVLLVCAVSIHRSFSFILNSLHFYHVFYEMFRLQENLMDLGRYPVSIYKGVIKQVFYFVIPLAFMFSFPARMIVGKLTFDEFLLAIAFTVVFSLLSRLVWNSSIKHYESANG